ncbi:MAG: hypothetical protein HUU60_03175 [Armatimonadetes bacterium]|nr:hypothetical protein [Armatimonadota bacterium]
MIAELLAIVLANGLHEPCLRSSASVRPIAVVENFGDTDVLDYDLEIEIVPSQGRLIGRNKIFAVSQTQGLAEFTFRLDVNLPITGLLLDDRPIGFTRLNNSTVRAHFDQTYNSGQSFVLEVAYDGQPVSEGFGSIVYGTYTSGAPYVYTLSEPWYAYTWWPNKDDNTDKATFSFAVTAPQELTVAANGRSMGVENLSGNRRKFLWRTDYPMVPYLLAFGATVYNTWSRPFNHAGGQMPVDFYIVPQSDSTGNRQAWELCLPMLTTFGQLYGEYPFIEEKYGIYQFSFGGGMEHQTMTGQGGWGESLTAHELAHQWWGDMITCATWHDIWLNEGFATYSEALWLENKPGSSGLAALKSAMNSRRPQNVGGTVYRYDISTVNSIFSSTYSYRKGGWALHMLRGVLGDEMFYRSLEAYRKQFQYQSVTTDQFKDVVEETVGQDLDYFFNQWIYGGGAPAYEWGAANTLINGRRFLLVRIRQTQTSYPLFKMPIDFRATVSGAQQRWRLWNDAAVQHYVIPVAASASSAQFDPDAWILATNVSNVSYVSGPPTIVAMNPSPFTDGATNVDRIEISFHTPVNASANHFQVMDAANRSYEFAFEHVQSSGLVRLNFKGPLLPGDYRVVVSDQITAVNSGQRLDGEILSPDKNQALPSGNGLASGSAALPFRIVR